MSQMVQVNIAQRVGVPTSTMRAVEKREVQMEMTLAILGRTTIIVVGGEGSLVVLRHSLYI